jgi:predicted transcriptional regulator of viral defense system
LSISADVLGKKGIGLNSSTIQKVLSIVKKTGVIRPRDLDKHGIDRKYLNLMYHQGLIDQICRGLYVSKEMDLTERHSFVEVSSFAPKAVICLLSALNYHGLTTQLPSEVWIAINRKAWLPKEPRIPMRVVRFSGQALGAGIEERQIEGVRVRIYNPAKTVADCFKYRNKIGLDVAIEALRDCYRKKKCTVDDLLRYAHICRVANVMKPYLEAIV